jgi:hypothetical protein
MRRMQVPSPSNSPNSPEPLDRVQTALPIQSPQWDSGCPTGHDLFPCDLGDIEQKFV